MDISRKREGIEGKFYNLCLEITKELGLEIYDMIYNPSNFLLRLFIMNPETKTALIEDCAAVDRAMTPYVESEDWMPKSLTLEVSSPGVYRSLNTRDHFEWVVGKNIQLGLNRRVTEEDFPGVPKKIKGTQKFIVCLNKVNETGIEVEFDGFQMSFEFSDIKKANLE